MSTVPPISQSGLYQPWFVINAYIMKTSKKNTNKVSIKSLIEFGYSPKRFDVIKNYQEVDWRFYRDYLTDIQKKWNCVTIRFVRQMIDQKSSKKRIKQLDLNYHFPVSDHHVPPNWLNNDMIHQFEKIQENNPSKPPLSMQSYAYNLPNYISNKKCSRPWHEC